MKRSEALALLIAGNTRIPFLRRLPRLHDRLGPVRSSSLRLASRIANSLNAGTPVQDFQAFDRCAVILISLPETLLAPSLDELAEASIRWRSKTVLLINSRHDSSALAKLAFLGAATASVTPLPGLEDRVFVLDGHRRALNVARTLIEQPGVKTVTMGPGRKSLFEAAVNFSTGLALPLLTATVETLRSCGMSQAHALFVADRLFQQTLRSYAKAGRKGWDGPLPLEDQQALRLQVQALFKLNPLLASYFYESAIHVVRLFRKDPTWVKELESEARPRIAS